MNRGNTLDADQPDRWSIDHPFDQIRNQLHTYIYLFAYLLFIRCVRPALCAMDQSPIIPWAMMKAGSAEAAESQNSTAAEETDYAEQTRKMAHNGGESGGKNSSRNIAKKTRKGAPVWEI